MWLQIMQQTEMLDVVSKLEEHVLEIRENERIISDSIDLLATNLQAVQDCQQEVSQSVSQSVCPLVG